MSEPTAPDATTPTPPASATPPPTPTPPPPPTGAPVATDEPGAAATLVVPAAVGEPAATVAPEAKAAGTRSRRRLLLAIGIPVGAIVLLGIGLGIAFAVQTDAHAPDKPVAAYLDALVAGEAEAAADLLENAPTGALIDDEIFSAATDRITGYTIGKTTTAGTTAKVIVEFTTDSGGWSEVVPLVSTGRDLLWNVWAVDGSAIGEVEVAWYAPAGIGLSANGVTLPSALTGRESLPAFPGTYEFAPVAPGELITAAPESATIGGLSASAGTQVALPVTLTDEGTAAAKSALKVFLNNCVKQHVLSPKGRCGFGILPDDQTYPTLNWTIERRPSVTFEGYSGTGFEVVTTKTGVLKLRGENANYIATGIIDDYKYYGYVDLVDGAITFTSMYED